MAKMCAFCSHTASLSAEHIWSQWITKAFQSTTPSYRLSRKDQLGKVKEWSSPEINFKARVVCKQCNETWMSELETRTKSAMLELIMPLSSESVPPTILSPAKLGIIAAFAFKTAVVINHSAPHGMLYYPLGQRRRFRRSLKIPSGIQMWIGDFRSSRADRSGVLKAAHGKAKPRTKFGMDLHVCTFVCGRLLLQVLGYKWANRNRRRLFDIDIDQSEDWQNAAIPFWPLGVRDVIWPPPESLNHESINQFSSRWGTAQIFQR